MACNEGAGDCCNLCRQHCYCSEAKKENAKKEILDFLRRKAVAAEEARLPMDVLADFDEANKNKEGGAMMLRSWLRKFVAIERKGWRLAMTQMGPLLLQGKVYDDIGRSCDLIIDVAWFHVGTKSYTLDKDVIELVAWIETELAFSEPNK